jgi:hypothetical protein
MISSSLEWVVLPGKTTIFLDYNQYTLRERFFRKLHKVYLKINKSISRSGLMIASDQHIYSMLKVSQCIID